MKHLPYVVLLLSIVTTTLVGFQSLAQAAPPAQQSTKLTFDNDDLLNAMTGNERQDFLDRRQELKELQEAGRQLKKGSAGRKAVLSAFTAKKNEFDRKFDHFRGINGRSVTVHGSPPPSKGEILSQVINGGSGLHPHWNRDKSGAVVGSKARPKNKPANTAVAVDMPAADTTMIPRSAGSNGCTHGVYGIPDDTPECNAAMRR